MHAQRPVFKFGQNVSNRRQGPAGLVAMRYQEPVQQVIHKRVSMIGEGVWARDV